jgi:basic amino acid/polyamine antiporter, APA family
MPEHDRQEPARAGISVLHGATFIIGIVVGIGIFRSPQLVAQNVADETLFIALWIVGGLITFVGALVYAELASAHPSGGGEYHFLSRALGRPVGLLFAWARITVIQTGAIAAVAFAYGDYAQQLLSLGAWGPALHAALALSALTAVNLTGATRGKRFQLLLTGMTMVAVVAVIAAGLLLTHAPAATTAPASSTGTLGLAMIFVLLTYGGWNEAAYLSAEIDDVRRNMVRVLLIATGVIVLIFLLINLAFLNILGLEGIRQSSAVGASAMRAVAGPSGATALAIMVCCAALAALNGMIFTGARLYQAVGNDLPVLNRLGIGGGRDNTPTAAIIAQSTIAIGLVAFGALTRDGFEAMAQYTAPVFWLFLLLVGVSYFILRRHPPERERPFRAPLYPLTPALFCLTCSFLLYSSLVHTGLGAFVGVVMLLIGVPVVWLATPRSLLKHRGTPP